MKKIVVFGGGTGLSHILKGLKLFPVNVSAIISVADNGQSTGVLKKELDILLFLFFCKLFRTARK